ncbi:coiled-coil domain-containing protein 160 [Pyxicephalus adspersus]|uniref:Coiled-coil domain-containing protein 160 n=1 Tax=Pyxicephalus adspersus TaxID=30357 RepID=A0AAV3A024_PYXAD|nr:TPA: hypothetical protein GDO54_017642 [Pyxicephalus adspersus]
MEDQKKHWVEELFAPHFTTKDLFYETFEPDILLSERVAKERAKKVEGIYQAALCKLQEDEKQERKKRLSRMIIQDYKSSAQETPTAAQSITCASCQNLITSSSKTVGAPDSCIWSEHELNLLRQEMNKKHSEGIQLKLQLDACKLELSELKTKRKETEQELEALRAELAASKRYTECKNVFLKHMQKEDAKKDAEIQFLKKDQRDKVNMLHNLTNSLQQTRREMQDLQLQNNDLEYEVKSLRQQQGLENIFAVENMKLKFSRKVNRLREEIEFIKAEKEKRSDQVNIAGLALK